MIAREAKKHYQRLEEFSQVNRIAAIFYNANPVLKPMSPIDLTDEDVLSFLRDLEIEQCEIHAGGRICSCISWIRPGYNGSRSMDFGRWKQY